MPLATTEGNLVASYKLGMKLYPRRRRHHHHGHRRPDAARTRLLLRRARQAWDFGEWLAEHFEDVAAAAQTTTSSGGIVDIQQFRSQAALPRGSTTPGDAADGTA